MKQPRQHLPDQRALCNIGLTQAMHFDLFGPHAGIGANDRLETLTGQDPAASDLDRGNGDDVVGAHIEPCRLAIDRNNLVCRSIGTFRAVANGRSPLNFILAA
jgi:hypothetical protein